LNSNEEFTSYHDVVLISFTRFLTGAKQAVLVVSKKLSEGKVDELDDFLTPQVSHRHQILIPDVSKQRTHS
jgi:hypothetical protein